jgi:two-component system, sensor histidine kinase and response regulator
MMRTKILVIEDERPFRQDIVDWLTLEGYAVVGAEDGIVGIETAFQYIPDLILCDILMPRLDGYGVLSEVHANPVTAAIPFIFLTGRSAQEDILKGINLGADDYITKPFTRLELLQAIQTWLAKNKPQNHDHQYQITQLQHALAQANEHRLLKATLISMFSHDFANSLTSILMTNSLLRNSTDSMDPNRRLAHLNRIEASARLLLQMLDDLLIIAQIETGSLNLEPELLKVGEFFQRMQEDCQAIYGGRYQIVLEGRRNGLIRVDARLLRLIIVNLITHATKASSPGSTVRVILDNRIDECIVMIQDQGTGISVADRQRIFDALQQSSDVDSVAITGLELAIVKHAVALQGGTIHLDGQTGAGKTVIVQFPLWQDDGCVDRLQVVGN